MFEGYERDEKGWGRGEDRGEERRQVEVPLRFGTRISARSVPRIAIAFWQMVGARSKRRKGSRRRRRRILG